MVTELRLRYYASEFLKLHCANVRGKQILAKPILLLAVIQSLDDRVIVENKFPWGKGSETFNRFKTIYENLYKGYLPSEYQTPIFKPFFHLKSEGFWHLKLSNLVAYPKASSVGFLNRNIEYAFLDDNLWEVLQDPGNRNYLREIVVLNYLR